MTEIQEGGQVAWYDITIAGKEFNIASRRGEAHIRQVERLLEEIVEDLKERDQGHNTVNLALLTALNLADQLITLQASLEAGFRPWDDQLRKMVERLDAVVPEGGAPLHMSKGDAAAVFD